MNGSRGGSFYNPRMRFWLLVLLMVLMPLQVSMAAVGQYCQHETVASVNHLGHHVHQHQTPVQADSNADIGKAVAADMDCGACHSSCSMAIPDAEGFVNIEASLTFSPVARVRLGLAPVDVPDRPQWRALA